MEPDNPDDIESIKAMVEAQTELIQKQTEEIKKLKKMNAELMVKSAVPDPEPEPEEPDETFEDLVAEALAKARAAFGGTKNGN